MRKPSKLCCKPLGVQMIEIPDPDSVGGVCDWVELTVLVRNRSLSKAAVASAIEATAGEEAREAFIASVWRELERRERLYSRSYFRVEGGVIEPGDDPKLPEYRACILLSLYGAQGSALRRAKLFERLSCEAIRRYLSGQAVVFGWPFDPDDTMGEGNGSQIERKIRRLAEDLCERFSEPPPSRFNDRGLDVVGWIPFADKRSSQIVVLMQCTIDQNWKDKIPVPFDAWCQYIHWACDPVKAFAVPRVVDDLEWHEACVDKGILFDRVRIVNSLSDDARDTSLREELSAWVEERLADFD